MKRKGGFLMFLGTVLILAAGALTWFNIRDSRQAEVASEQAVQQLLQQITAAESNHPQGDSAVPQSTDFNEILPPNYVRFPDMEMPVTHVNGQDYVAAVSIPSLDLELPVISQWSYPALKVAPCRYQGSAYTKDLILMAHNYESHFGGIKNLRPGDLVDVMDMDGNTFSYQVVELEELPGTAVEDMQSGTWDLTLFTCTYGGRSRVTVRCDEISNFPAP